jgi:hypothetical protein
VATGSAAGPATAYLFRLGLADSGWPLEFAQGRFAGRPSKLQVRCDSSNRLLVSGEVWPVAHGFLDLDAISAGGAGAADGELFKPPSTTRSYGSRGEPNLGTTAGSRGVAAGRREGAGVYGGGMAAGILGDVLAAKDVETFPARPRRPSQSNNGGTSRRRPQPSERR